jgi:hypothetical protein
MNTMRGALAFLLASVAALQAAPVDYRWTIGFGQGTLEAIIRNEFGSSLNIYCPAGQTDTTPGMFVSVDKVRPRAGEQIDVQIVVDNKNHPFYLEEIQFRASGRANLNSLYALVDALAASRARGFVVEFPRFRMSERFSLMNAREVLGSGKDFLQGCG